MACPACGWIVEPFSDWLFHKADRVLVRTGCWPWIGLLALLAVGFMFLLVYLGWKLRSCDCG
jgi:hypothetical protein